MPLFKRKNVGSETRTEFILVLISSNDEHGDELVQFHEYSEFLDQKNSYPLVKKTVKGMYWPPSSCYLLKF
jgi:hypothetical protein